MRHQCEDSAAQSLTGGVWSGLYSTWNRPTARVKRTWEDVDPIPRAKPAWSLWQATRAGRGQLDVCV